MQRLLLAAAAAAALLTGGAAAATVVTESGDAGGTVATAQDATGATRIEGSLIDLGGGTADVDFYRIVVNDADAFAVSVTAALSQDNDTELFLFDENLDLVLSDDDGGSGLLSAFLAGELSGFDVGTYFLAITIYYAEAANGGIVTADDPSPFQTGAYALTLDGVAPVPVPGAAVLLATGLGALGAARRKSAKTCAFRG